jgi:hypothetical protein
MTTKLKYPFSAYNKHLCLDLSIGMWLVLAFLLRPYLIMIMSVVNRSNRMELINLFYADRSHLALGALAAIPAVLLVIAWNRRRPGAVRIVRALWRRGRELLAASTALNALVVLLPLLTGRSDGIDYVGIVQLGLCAWILVYLYDTERVRDTFADFPEEVQPASQGESDRKSEGS